MSEQGEQVRGGAAIRPEPNGPLVVEGVETFENSRGEPVKVRRVMRLCRCGNSRNKPFCDGTHGTAGWNDEESLEGAEDRRDRDDGDGHRVQESGGDGLER